MGLGGDDVHDLVEGQDLESAIQCGAAQLGQGGVVLDPAEPLLLAEGENLSIVEQGGGGVVVLAES